MLDPNANGLAGLAFLRQMQQFQPKPDPSQPYDPISGGLIGRIMQGNPGGLIGAIMNRQSAPVNPGAPPPPGSPAYVPGGQGPMAGGAPMGGGMGLMDMLKKFGGGIGLLGG